MDKHNTRLARAIEAYYRADKDREPDTIFWLLKQDPVLLLPIEHHNGQVLFKKLPAGPGCFALPAFTCTDELARRSFEAARTMKFSEAAGLCLKDPRCRELVINCWSRPLRLDKQALSVLARYRPQSHIHILAGSLADLPCDAIVHVENDALTDRQIRLKAGKEGERRKPVAAGQVQIHDTRAMDTADKIVRTTLTDHPANWSRKVLDKAIQHDIRTIAFPAMTHDKEQAGTRLQELSRWLDRHPDLTMGIYICCCDQDELKAWKEAAGRD